MKVITSKDNKSELIKVQPKEFLSMAEGRYPHAVNLFDRAGGELEVTGFSIANGCLYEVGSHKVREVYRKRTYAIDHLGRRTPGLPDGYVFVPHELLAEIEFPADLLVVCVGPDESPDYNWIDFFITSPDQINKDMAFAVEIGSSEYQAIIEQRHEYKRDTRVKPPMKNQ